MPRTTTLLLSLFLTSSAFATARIEFNGVGFTHQAYPGETLRIELRLYNHGPDDARNTVLRFPLPPDSAWLPNAAPAGWSCTTEGDVVVCRTPSFRYTGGDFPIVLIVEARLSSNDAGGFFELRPSLTADNALRPADGVLHVSIPRLLHVTTTADSGDGSLREVLETANELCIVHCEVRFDLPPSSSFQPLTPLPPITACALVHLRGGSTERTGPRPFEISGRNISTGHGLEVLADCDNPYGGLRVDGFAINDFPDDGIRIAATGSTYAATLEGVFLGTDMTGREARPNGSRGVVVYSPVTHLSMESSIASGNGRSGVFVWDARAVYLAGNAFGLGENGQPLGNGASGIFVRQAAVSGNLNTIAHNRHWGISLFFGTRIYLSMSSIFSNANSGIDWGLDGPSANLEGAGVPNAPVITSAVYDAATARTVVRGTIEIGRALGQRYSVQVYSNASLNARGEAEGETFHYPYAQLEGKAGIHEWETRIPEDLRGRIVTALTGVAAFPDSLDQQSSEFGRGVTVR